MTPYGAWGSGVMAALFPGGRDDILIADLSAIDPLSSGKCLMIYNPGSETRSMELPQGLRYDILTKRETPALAELAPGTLMVLCENSAQDPYPQGWSEPEPVGDAFVNFAQGMKATASSRESLMYDAMNATTGDWHDVWHSVDSPRREWLALDLGQPRDIRRIHMIWEYRPGMIPLAFTIEGSLDGEEWTRLDGREMNKAQATFHRVSGRFRYIRVTFLDKKNRHNPYGVTDFQVFGEA